jgi:hypothetical protein
MVYGPVGVFGEDWSYNSLDNSYVW